MSHNLNDKSIIKAYLINGVRYGIDKSNNGYLDIDEHWASLSVSLGVFQDNAGELFLNGKPFKGTEQEIFLRKQGLKASTKVIDVKVGENNYRVAHGACEVTTKDGIKLNDDGTFFPQEVYQYAVIDGTLYVLEYNGNILFAGSKWEKEFIKRTDKSPKTYIIGDYTYTLIGDQATMTPNDTSIKNLATPERSSSIKMEGLKFFDVDGKLWFSDNTATDRTNKLYEGSTTQAYYEGLFKKTSPEKPKDQPKITDPIKKPLAAGNADLELAQKFLASMTEPIKQEDSILGKYGKWILVAIAAYSAYLIKGHFDEKEVKKIEKNAEIMNRGLVSVEQLRKMEREDLDFDLKNAKLGLMVNRSDTGLMRMNADGRLNTIQPIRSTGPLDTLAKLQDIWRKGFRTPAEELMKRREVQAMDEKSKLEIEKLRQEEAKEKHRYDLEQKRIISTENIEEKKALVSQAVTGMKHDIDKSLAEQKLETVRQQGLVDVQKAMKKTPAEIEADFRREQEKKKESKIENEEEMISKYGLSGHEEYEILKPYLNDPILIRVLINKLEKQKVIRNVSSRLELLKQHLAHYRDEITNFIAKYPDLKKRIKLSVIVKRINDNLKTKTIDIDKLVIDSFNVVDESDPLIDDKDYVDLLVNDDKILKLDYLNNIIDKYHKILEIYNKGRQIVIELTKNKNILPQKIDELSRISVEGLLYDNPIFDEGVFKGKIGNIIKDYPDKEQKIEPVKVKPSAPLVSKIKPDDVTLKLVYELAKKYFMIRGGMTEKDVKKVYFDMLNDNIGGIESFYKVNKFFISQIKAIATRIPIYLMFIKDGTMLNNDIVNDDLDKKIAFLVIKFSNYVYGKLSQVYFGEGKTTDFIKYGVLNEKDADRFLKPLNNFKMDELIDNFYKSHYQELNIGKAANTETPEAVLDEKNTIYYNFNKLEKVNEVRKKSILQPISDFISNIKSYLSGYQRVSAEEFEIISEQTIDPEVIVTGKTPDPIPKEEETIFIEESKK